MRKTCGRSVTGHATQATKGRLCLQGRLRGSGCKDAKDLQAPGGKGIGQGVATTLRRNLFQIVKLRLCRQRLRGTGCRVERVERLERRGGRIAIIPRPCRHGKAQGPARPVATGDGDMAEAAFRDVLEKRAIPMIGTRSVSEIIAAEQSPQHGTPGGVLPADRVDASREETPAN